MKLNFINLLKAIIIIILINFMLIQVGTPDFIQYLFTFIIGFYSRAFGIPIWEKNEDNK